jgi:hypothetical protein
MYSLASVINREKTDAGGRYNEPQRYFEVVIQVAVQIESDWRRRGPLLQIQET